MTNRPSEAEGDLSAPRPDDVHDAAPLVPPAEGDTVEAIQDELRALRFREQEIIKLLGSGSPDRILHDVRNLLNEVQLLRYLAKAAEGTDG